MDNASARGACRYGAWPPDTGRELSGSKIACCYYILWRNDDVDDVVVLVVSLLGPCNCLVIVYRASFQVCRTKTPYPVHIASMDREIHMTESKANETFSLLLRASRHPTR